MNRRVQRSLLLVPAIVAITLGVAHSLVPLPVRWEAWQLHSSDPDTRGRARASLLARPRADIEAVYPELVAEEVKEEASGGGDPVVIVARSGQRGAARHYDVEERLAGNLPQETRELSALGTLVCPTAQKLYREDANEELVVIARRGGALELRVAIPLEPGSRDRVLAEVRAALSSR
jgi:hypothetical protein